MPMSAQDEFKSENKKPFYHNMTTIIIGTTVVDWRTMEVDTPPFPEHDSGHHLAISGEGMVFLAKNMMRVAVVSLELLNHIMVQKIGRMSFQAIKIGYQRKENAIPTFLYCWVACLFIMKLMRQN